MRYTKNKRRLLDTLAAEEEFLEIVRRRTRLAIQGNPRAKRFIERLLQAMNV